MWESSFVIYVLFNAKISQIIISKDFLSDIPRIKITKEFLTLALMRGALVSYFRNDCATLFVEYTLDYTIFYIRHVLCLCF